MKRASILLALCLWGFGTGAQGGEAGARDPAYLALIWHQHQPLYVDPTSDALRAPWVRTHATKDYFDMAAMIGEYPRIHACVNLTSSMLVQLQDYYVERLGPYVRGLDGPGPVSVDARAFLAEWGGRTDPWIDLALLPTAEWGPESWSRIVGEGWSARSISAVIIGRWPELGALLGGDLRHLPDAGLRSVLAHFYAANFDPDFLCGPVALPGGGSVDLSDLVEETARDRFRFRQAPDLRTTNRLVAEAWRVMNAVVPQHRILQYDPARGTGQLELLTTPFYHPILPLLIDSDLASHALPQVPLPTRFSFAEDATLQVRQGAAFFRRLFGQPPRGFWPAEGSVAEEVVTPFAEVGALWIATDQGVLARSWPRGQVAAGAYRVDAGEAPGTGAEEPSLAVIFRDTELSDRIGFTYQSGPPDGESTAADFVAGVLERVREARAAQPGRDVLITVILDGENAWEWYENDNDGKHFLHALYRRLEAADQANELRTVTPTEYILGNPRRGIPAHPIDQLPELEPLWAGSWIRADFSTWVGEREENAAWEALLEVRQKLQQSGIPAPDPDAPPPPKGTRERAGWEAWQAMLAAEGSDWFWWYGADQEIGGGDDPFDETYRALLSAVGRWARAAGASFPAKDYPSFLDPRGETAALVGGTMTRASAPVLFTVDCRAIQVPEAIYIVGGHAALGNWEPNLVRMHDDGGGGDEVAGDGIWSLAVDLPAQARVEFKFTNSGTRGSWVGEEFSQANRSVEIRSGQHRNEAVFGVRP